MASFGLVPLEALRRGVPTLEARRVVRNGGEGRNRTNPGKDHSPTTVLKTAEPTRTHLSPIEGGIFMPSGEKVNPHDAARSRFTTLMIFPTASSTSSSAVKMESDKRRLLKARSSLKPIAFWTWLG